MRLRGKVALITGGATGIGYGTAQALAREGAKLVLAQIDCGPAADAIARLEGAEAIALQVDISNRKSVDSMVDAAVERFGGIDVLVNNAAVTGKQAVSPFLECSEAALDHILAVNLKGTFHCSQAVARHMVSTGRRGSIVHISSVGGYAAQEFASVYCAAKAGVISLAQSMSLELAPLGIRVNCVAPGDIRTETNAEIVSDLKQSGASGKYLRVTPMGRRGLPGEVGNAVAFLASEEASFITGATLLVDGGFLSY